MKVRSVCNCPRPVNITVGYHGDDERTAGAMRGGYYRTGDVATRDADGYLTFIGRADDVFKAADYRISPFELESVLIEHPAIVEAAVIPSPDPLRQTVPKAVVTVSAGYEPSRELAMEILRFSRQALADLSVWWGTPTLLTAALMIGLVSFAYYAARAGEPLFGNVLAE